MKSYLKIAAIVFVLATPFLAQAQRTRIYVSPDFEFATALELFQKEKYGAAQKLFINVAGSINDPNSLTQADAEYYAAICAIELFHDDAESRLLNFINDYPENEKTGYAYFQLGRFQYRKKSYRDAIQSFTKVNPLDLKENDLAEYHFKLGYSYFRAKRPEDAKKHLFLAKSMRSRYSAPATYFYSHISYAEGSYETALQGFQTLQNDENFKALIPYYITQIYFMQQKYDELLKVAPPLLEVSVPRRQPEIARMIGESYYHTRRYSEAIPYLEMYQEKSKQMSRYDFYQLGYAYYRIENFEKAIGYFEQVSGINDSLSENAYYHLGDCYIKSNNKQYAYNSFLAAYRSGIDPVIRENSLFNYAKLAYELSYNPYNEAINAFISYIEEYPKSLRIDEANTYLVNLYMGTRNYRSALESLDKIKNLNEELKAAYQKISYMRAVELFNNSLFNEALEMFEKSRKYTPDNSYLAESLFWTGETHYRLGNWDKAAEHYNAFLISPGAIMLDYYNMAHYNAGYAWFKKKQYNTARIAFQKYIATGDKSSPDILADAYLRAGDCFFVERSFDRAIEQYDFVVNQGKRDADYALYQRGMAEGAMGNYDRKTQTLSGLVTSFPRSKYVPDAEYELATTYNLLENYPKALEFYDRIIANYPKTLYAKKAQLNKGLIYFNTDRNDVALNTLKKLADDYPGTVEARQAIETIKNIYIEIDQVDEFIKWTKSRNYTEITSSEQDSITYLAAERTYMSGDCGRATEGFTNYLSKYPNGYFGLNARFYRAECAMRNSRFAEALPDYDVVAAVASKFTESALSRKAYIHMEQKDYQKAMEAYRRLETIAQSSENISLAKVQQMRCAVKLNMHFETIAASRKVIATPKISPQTEAEAHISIAKAAMAIDSTALAQLEFGWLVKNSKSEFAAAAQYNLALIQYRLGDSKKAEILIHELINQVPSYEYWIASGLILLSDILVQSNNILQAKAILQSIIDNYEGDDLKLQAQEKLNSIIASEKKAEIVPENTEEGGNAMPDPSETPENE